MNYASGEQAYVYTVKNRYKKGGNRLCTVLYHILRKIKYGDHECRNARTLYLHADNAPENKNNCFLTFMSELVQKGWFDFIILEFGPPGHTHNGRDAVHYIHNRIAGNFFSFTLGEFQSMWRHSWRKDGTLPTAVIADVQYDFAKRYENCDTISGFTNTVFDTKAVYAFKIQRSTVNTIEILWKQKASDAKWLGSLHQPNTPGFVLLSRLPVRKAPEIILPKTKVCSQKYINEVCGARMLEVMSDHIGEASAELAQNWLRKSMMTGSMPHEVVPDQPSVTKADWGPLVKVGAVGSTGEFFKMQPDLDSEMDTFWDLPDDLANRVQEIEADLQKARDAITGNPNIRYTKVRPDIARKQQKTQQLASEQKAANEVALDVEGYNHEESEVDELSSDHEGPAADSWGEPVELCEIGIFAVIYSQSGDDIGIDIVQVKNHDKGKKGEETFQGHLYTPATFSTCSSDCLKGKWHKAPNIDSSLKIYNCWSVLSYFKRWNKGGKLSKRTKDNILATLTFQGHPIFSDDLPESEEGNSDESAKDLDESDDNSYSDSGDGSGE